MDRLNLDLLTFDIGVSCHGPAAFADHVVSMIESSWETGADITLLPELLWMGLERFADQTNPIHGVASLFNAEVWPLLRDKPWSSDRAAVFGTTPFIDETGLLRNRALILSQGRWFHQDKIHLTPWESVFTGGGPLHVWNFRGLKIAVVICLDIEIPEISAALRGSGVDLILVPSATESLMGVERIARCADARSVELGCHVGLCHLVGQAESELIDENIGGLAAFSPSQADFAELTRQTRSSLFTEGFHRLRVTLDFEAIRRNRAATIETDPAKVVALPPEIRFL